MEKTMMNKEEIQSAVRFEDSLKFYFRFYINRIMDVFNEGYDWDVVSEMLREEKKFTDLIRPLVDKNSSATERERLQNQLDDGISDMESGRELSIEKAMAMMDEIIEERKTDDEKKNCETCHYYELTRIASYCTKGFRRRELEFGTEKGCKRWKKKVDTLKL